MLELLEILFENHFCEKVYLNKDHNQSINLMIFVIIKDGITKFCKTL